MTREEGKGMNDGVNWIGPRQCESSGCGQAALVDGKVLMRSSRRPDARLILDPDEWREFIRAVAAGDFDSIGDAQ
jgi:hypothetical protein